MARASRPEEARVTWSLACVAALVGAAGCDAKGPPAGNRPTGAAPASASAEDAGPPIRSRYPAARRLVAVGDLHGDLGATRAVLRLAGLLGADEHWGGGDTVLVQTGDVLDRGDDERAIVDLLARLTTEATAAGGAVHVLNGNHELMNAAGDFRYVTAGGMHDFDDAAGLDLGRPEVARQPDAIRRRYAALAPGGPYARLFARHPVVLVVGDTVFAHGGVLPAHARYGIERLNREVGAWLLGVGQAGRSVLVNEESPVWNRELAEDTSAEDCQTLATALGALGAARLVVGHTVQRVVTSACDGKLWRIDVGLSAYYGGEPAALEIVGARVRALGRVPAGAGGEPSDLPQGGAETPGR